MGRPFLPGVNCMRLASSVVTGTLAVGLAAAAAQGQVAATPPPPPSPDPQPLAGGTRAPDFVLPGATRYGVPRGPLPLCDLKGKKGVRAFFLKARTRGRKVPTDSTRVRCDQRSRG